MHFSSAPIPSRQDHARVAQRRQPIETLEPRRLLSTAPVADAGGNYEIFEGQEVLLNAGASTDAENNIVSYAWTVNGHQQPDETGPTLLMIWSELQGAGMGNGTADFDVSVTVKDATGLESTDSASLTVKNAPPVARFNVTRANPFAGWDEGRDITISSSVTSDWNSTVGSQYDYHTQITLNGVLVFNNQVTTGSSPPSIVYKLPNPGLLEVRVTVSDRDPTGAASAPATLDVFGEQDVFAVQVANVPISIQGFQANVTGAAEGTPFGVGIAAQAASNDVLTYEWWLERQVSPGVFVAEPAFFGPSSTALTPRDDGVYRIRVMIRDGDGQGLAGTGGFPVANLAPNPTVSGAPATAEVGTTVTLLANDNDPGLDDTHTFQWTVNGVLQASTSSSLDIDVDAAGTYEYALLVTDNAGASSLVTGSFDAVAPVLETATIAYAGQLHFTTSSTTDDTADITLRATIADPDGGDVTRATVTFFNTQTLQVYSSGVPVTALAGGTSTGFAATSFSHLLATDPEFLHIGVRVDAGGAYAAAEVEVIATISPPGDGKIIASGSILSTGSNGFFAAVAGTSILFAANARSTGDGIRGGVEMTFRSYHLPDGSTGSELRTYLIASTAVTSLGTTAGGTADRAAIIATVDIFDITDRKKQDYVLLQSGLSLEMTLTDGGKQGAGDSVAFTVWNSSCGLMFASHWDGSSATEDLLATGDIKVNGI